MEEQSCFPVSPFLLVGSDWEEKDMLRHRSLCETVVWAALLSPASALTPIITEASLSLCEVLRTKPRASAASLASFHFELGSY